MEKKKLNRKKITKVYSLFGIFGLFKANVSQRPLSPGLPKSGQLSVLAAIDGWREGKSHLRDAYDEEGIALYEKFLSLWKDADLGIAEVEDARERLAGLKSQ